MKMPPEFDQVWKQQFGVRLKKAIKEAGYETRAAFSRESGINETTLNNWTTGKNLPVWQQFVHLCEVLHCSADELLGLLIEQEKQHKTSRQEANGEGIINRSGTIWNIDYPKWLGRDHKRRKEIERGVDTFLGFVRDNRDAEDVFDELSITPEDAVMAVQAAFRSGTIRLAYVERDTKLEERLEDKFKKLKRVLVASVPDKNDGTIIRAEIVAFLAATNALARVDNSPRVIGVGSGYTILRFAELSVSSYSQFRKTEWLPIMAFPDGNFHHLAANAIAVALSQRHPNSTAIEMPFLSMADKHKVAPLLERYSRAEALFVTVSGLGRKKNRQGHERELFSEFRASDYSILLNDLERMYEILKVKNLEHLFVGEIVGLMLNEQGLPIPEIEKENSEFVFPYSLEYLKRVARNKFAWVVAARQYKAEAVAIAVKNELANALVIDSEIAEYLDNYS